LAQTTCLASFGPVFLVVAAVAGGGGHVWTCRDGGSGTGCGRHSRGGGGRLSLWWMIEPVAVVVTHKETTESL